MILTLGFVDTLASPRDVANANIDRVSELDALVQQEAYVQAFVLAVRGLEAANRQYGPRHVATAEWLHRTAEIAHLSGDQDTADHLAPIALDLRRELLGNDDPRLAETLVLRGVIARYAGNGTLAGACYDEASEVLDRASGDTRALRAELLQKKASLLRSSLRMEDAIPGYEKALAAYRDCVPASLPLADILTWTAWHLAHGGRIEEARGLAEEAISMLRSLGLERHGLMGTLLQLQAQAWIAEGRWDEATRALEEASEAYERSREGHFPGFSRRKSPVPSYPLAAVCQLELGRGEEAWESLQRSRLNVAAESMLISRWRDLDAAGWTRHRELAREAGRLARELNQAHARGSLSRALPHWDELLRELQVNAERYRRAQQFLGTHMPTSIDRADLQRHLDARTAVIGWLEMRPRDDIKEMEYGAWAVCWAYVLRDRGPVQWIPIWNTRDREEFFRIVAPHKSSVNLCLRAAGWALRAGEDPELREQCRQVGAVHFEPLRPYLEGVERLIVETGPSTLLVPVEMLVDSAGEYLVDEFEIAYTYSALAQLSLMGEEKRASGPPSRALVVADPIYAEGQETSTVAPLAANAGALSVTQLRKALARDPDALDRLPRLPFAAYEGERLQELLPGCTLLAGREANEAALNRLAMTDRLEEFDVIHLAAHALIDWIPERSTLALSRVGCEERELDDGLLDAGEIYLGWELDADLLTLSGCQTAWGPGSVGEYHGLDSVLLAVGARSVLASMWKVDDAATALLMERFYTHLLGAEGEPLSKAAALREAKRWLRDFRDDDGQRPFAHPIYWAGFLLIGQPG